jgi:hypothetical protein
MEKTHRRSLLKTQILASLREQPASSIVALARTLESSRPAVSRSLHLLKRQGIVQQHGRTWTLTDLGKAEAEEAVAQLQRSTTRVVEVAGQRFRALSRVGLDDGLAASLAIPAVPDLAAAAATAMADQLYAATSVDWIDDARSNWRAAAADAAASIGSIQEHMAEQLSALRGLSEAAPPLRALQTSAMDLGQLTQPLVDASDIGFLARSAWGAGFKLNNVLAAQMHESLLPLRGASLAAEMADHSAMAALHATTRQFELSLAEQLATPIGAALKIRDDQAALVQSIGAITAQLDEWPDAFTKAASSLADWTEQIGGAVVSAHDLKTTKIAEVLDEFARASVPEPLYSDSLRAFGLNGRRIHSPTYPLAPVQPIETVERANQRAHEALRRRNPDAADALESLETTLREVITVLLRRAHGPAWWGKTIPAKIGKNCARLKRDHDEQGGLPYDLIAFTSTHELGQIILHEPNWTDVFAPVFGKREPVEMAFRLIRPVKNDLQHFRLSSKTDYTWFLYAANVITGLAIEALNDA